MLSFNLSVIDIILVICVVILTILYLNTSKKYPEELSYRSITKNIKKQSYSPNVLSSHPQDQNEFVSTDDTNVKEDY